MVLKKKKQSVVTKTADEIKTEKRAAYEAAYKELYHTGSQKNQAKKK